MATYPKMTLAELRTAARQRADMVHSQFVSDDELTSYVNASYFELYDLLVQKYGNDYFVSESSFPLVSGTAKYGLPADFYKLLGVDLQVSGGDDGYVSLRPFTMAERNRHASAAGNWLGVSSLRYRISGNDLWFTPTPDGGQQVRLWYVPRLARLIDQTTLTVADPIAGDFVTIGGVATLTAGTQWTITAGNNPATAASIAAAINAAGIVDVSATSNGPVVTLVQDDAADLALTVGGTTIGASARLQFSSPMLSNGSQVADGISGWLEYVVTDAAIKMLQKEESDTTLLLAQKGALIRRIESAAENRDAGSPARVSDTQLGGGWPYGWGYGGPA